MTSLRGRTSFNRLAREGKRFGRGFLQLRVMPNSRTFNRLGVVISGKAVRKAVERNRIRRLVKESYRKVNDSLKTGYDIVIIVRGAPEINRMDYVRRELMRLMIQSGLISD